MPISREEVQLLKQRLHEIEQELLNRFGAKMPFAEYNPRPSDLFEYFVLYNAALSTDPTRLVIGVPFTRGDARSAHFIPFGLNKPHKTAIKMGRTLVPSITCLSESTEFAFWFDRSILPGLRPDIVVRKGHFETKTDYSRGYTVLLKDDSWFAEYSLTRATDIEHDSFFEQTPSALRIGKSIYFNAKNEFRHPPLIIECKSYGARLGNPQVYSDHADRVVIVSPEKLYEPKKENMMTIKVSPEFDYDELRGKLRPHLQFVLGKDA
jgi:hypothetical protein